MISKIGFVTLAVADQDVMAEFFVDTLGFAKTVDAEMWPGARWVQVTPPDAQTALVLERAADFGREPDKQYPLGFSCADLAETHARLTAAGVPVTEPETHPWGSFIKVTDPEGREFVVNDKG
ncbi:VOC family protein [Pseudonocardia acaciae]|uniref:VOC family protein n=1 Tax=Pseudonocardia acaciae TaxID=551276 RepID=UPI00048F3290|nr:VOC family protein [Pseudonocardia acaciae]